MLEIIVVISLAFGGVSVLFDHKWQLSHKFNQRRANKSIFRKWCFFCLYFWSSFIIYLTKLFIGADVIYTWINSLESFLLSFLFALATAFCSSLFQSLFNYLHENYSTRRE